MSRKRADKSLYDGFGQRMKYSLSQYGAKAKLAKNINVTTEAVRTWCNGESLPDPEQLVFISKHIGRSIDWLLTGGDAQAVSYPEKEIHDKVNFILTTSKEEVRSLFRLYVDTVYSMGGRMKTTDEMLRKMNESLQRLEGKLSDSSSGTDVERVPIPLAVKQPAKR